MPKPFGGKMQEPVEKKEFGQGTLKTLLSRLMGTPGLETAEAEEDPRVKQLNKLLKKKRGE